MASRGNTRTVATVTAVLLVLVVAIAVLPRFSGADTCVPTSTRECGCLTESSELEGLTSTDKRTLSAGQMTFEEHSFEHDGTESTYRVFSHGINRDKPAGVVVRLHGDGAYEYLYSKRHPSCLAAVAASHNLILVQPLTPAEDRTWWTDLDTNTDWLEAFYDEEISTMEGVDPDRVWWMGYSGGAEMISYGLLPSAGRVITAGAILVGGGGAPRRTGHSVPEERVADLPLYWVTGSRDTGEDPRETFDALSAASEGADAYRSQGFEAVSTDFWRDDNHISIDQVEILHSILRDN
ncbi:hypothetical protein B842_09060 [Corynebacterium humireducens NBRC 106098 = DSM 45392]|uniref:Uncharacterized protein n=1 Tax=Corynebacterium humireducens NBRC 106098 = DSM 45392 TaxID=1223515 RepID=A0A0B5D488_9CORY|nr:hypothetical protein [Corynebacterium humireducens]AJE33661.1 hypothetical protein B842_09060 [Corynebacterium humireducens NBRC 106098 = DSM 45392]